MFKKFIKSTSRHINKSRQLTHRITPYRSTINSSGSFRSLTGTHLFSRFCQQPQEPQITLSEEELQKKQEFNEEVLEIDSENKINVKFNDDIISYEVPDELKGTTFGKQNSRNSKILHKFFD